MKIKSVYLVALIVLNSLFLIAGNGFAQGSYGPDVNSLCSPQQPFTGDCALCHDTNDYALSTPAKTAYLAGGQTLINYFCPPASTCTDNDGDTFAVEGGNCGQVDCNDNSNTIYPGATEICGDGIDQNCDGVDTPCSGNTVPPNYLLLRKKIP